MIVQRNWLSMADTWLTGFRYRVPFYSLPHCIYRNAAGGAVQTNIPVCVYLGSDLGDGEKRDGSMDRVFDEIGGNWAKMAVTTEDGTTQCEVSVLDWDSTNKKGIFWFLAPEIGKFSADNSLRMPNKFYLYYDYRADDNTSYVGEPGDAPSNTVWSDFLWGFMLQEAPVDDTRTLLDFVGTELDGKWLGTATGKQVDYDVGNCKAIKKALDFEAGDTDYVSHASAGDFYPQDAGTLFYWGDIESRGTDKRVLSYSSGSGNDKIWEMGINSGGHFFAEFYNNNVAIAACADSADVITDGDEFVMFTYNGGSSLGDAELYSSGGALIVQDTPSGAAIGNPPSTPQNPLIGTRAGGWGWWDGKVAFVAMASIACDKNWMAIWNRALKNNLFVFQQTEEQPTEEYSYRLPIHVKPDNIDSDLYSYMLKVFLGTSVGDDDQDVTAVFDELKDQARKLRITDADNKTLPVDVYYWDEITEFAVMAVTVDFIDATDGAHLFLYFDSGMPLCGETLNTQDTRSTPSCGTEDCRFSWHAHKTKPNYPLVAPYTSAYQNGWLGIDGAQSLVGIDDNNLNVDTNFGPYIDMDYGEYISFADNSLLDRGITSPFTLEVFLRLPSEQNNQIRIMAKRDSADPFQGWELHFDSGLDNFRGIFDIGASTSVVATSTNNVDDNAWHHVVFTYDGSDTVAGALMYMDGVADRSVITDNFPMGGSMANSKALQIGARDGAQFDPMDLQIIEARYYVLDISADRIKANNQNFRDGLLSFDTVEEKADYDNLSFESIAVTPVTPRHIGEETLFVDQSTASIVLTPGSHTVQGLAQLAMIGSGDGNLPKAVTGTGARPDISDPSGNKPGAVTGSGNSPGIASASGG